MAKKLAVLPNDRSLVSKHVLSSLNRYLFMIILVDWIEETANVRVFILEAFRVRVSRRNNALLSPSLEKSEKKTFSDLSETAKLACFFFLVVEIFVQLCRLSVARRVFFL